MSGAAQSAHFGERSLEFTSMTSLRKITVASLTAIALAAAAVPASAEPFHGHGGWGGGMHGHGPGGWGGGHGWDGGHRHWGGGWGPGGYLAVGGLGLATGALIANSYGGPAYAYGPSCGETVSTHYNAYGELVKVVRQNPC